ncbi:hypothetical protein NPIL_484001, partial [Nephila pilipes]
SEDVTETLEWFPWRNGNYLIERIVGVLAWKTLRSRELVSAKEETEDLLGNTKLAGNYLGAFITGVYEFVTLFNY